MRRAKVRRKEKAMSVHRELLRGGHAPAERRHESVVPKLDLSHRIIRHTRKTKKKQVRMPSYPGSLSVVLLQYVDFTKQFDSD